MPNQRIFRAYDIRGLVTELTPSVIRQIASAIAKQASYGTVVIGHDQRDSSKIILKTLCDTLLEAGCNLIDIGTCSTPMLYFARIHYRCQHGLMITGSHHSDAYNGIKMIFHDKHPTSTVMQALQQPTAIPHNPQGQYTLRSITEDYHQAILEHIPSGHGHIVIEGDHPQAAKLLTTLGYQVSTLPISSPNQDPLCAAVVNLNADLGMRFDSDGDRLTIVDERGYILPIDYLLLILIKDVLARSPGATIITDCKCSHLIEQMTTSWGGHVVRCATGHAYIKEALSQHNAVFAGEYSGHIFYQDWHHLDDALYAACRLLAICQGQPLSSLTRSLPRTILTSELLIPMEDEEKVSIISALQAQPHPHCDLTDGLRLDFPNGWGLIRGSCTSANLSLRFEADNLDALHHITTHFQELLTLVGASRSFQYEDLEVVQYP